MDVHAEYNIIEKQTYSWCFYRVKFSVMYFFVMISLRHFYPANLLISTYSCLAGYGIFLLLAESLFFILGTILDSGCDILFTYILGSTLCF